MNGYTGCTWDVSSVGQSRGLIEMVTRRAKAGVEKPGELRETFSRKRWQS
jgi:hypothetical protein